MTLDDVNEFSPDFERHFYTAAIDLSDEEMIQVEVAANGADADGTSEKINTKQPKTTNRRRDELLVTVRAHDQDCSSEFGSICRYELLSDSPQSASDGSNGQHGGDQLEGLSVDLAGRIWLRHLPKSWLAAVQERRKQQLQSQSQANPNLNSNNGAYLMRSFQVIAYDCAGKKSQTPATVQVSLNKLCRPSLKGKSSGGSSGCSRGQQSGAPMTADSWLIATPI